MKKVLFESAIQTLQRCGGVLLGALVLPMNIVSNRYLSKVRQVIEQPFPSGPYFWEALLNVIDGTTRWDSLVRRTRGFRENATWRANKLLEKVCQLRSESLRGDRTNDEVCEARKQAAWYLGEHGFYWRCLLS